MIKPLVRRSQRVKNKFFFVFAKRKEGVGGERNWSPATIFKKKCVKKKHLEVSIFFFFFFLVLYYFVFASAKKKKRQSGLVGGEKMNCWHYLIKKNVRKKKKPSLHMCDLAEYHRTNCYFVRSFLIYFVILFDIYRLIWWKWNKILTNLQKIIQTKHKKRRKTLFFF